MSQGVVVEVADRAGTAAVAAAVLGVLAAGDVVVLDGPLGAGKTAFVQDLAAAAGVTVPVTSPTFTLVQTYPTTRGWDLLHADLYRVEHLQEALDLALPELLEDGMVGLVEWGRRALAALPRSYLLVGLAPGPDSGSARTLTLTAEGGSWPARLAALACSLEGGPR